MVGRIGHQVLVLVASIEEEGGDVEGLEAAGKAVRQRLPNRP